MNSTTGDGGESLTVHQLLQQWAPAYRQRFGAALPQRQRQVLHKILACRTPALGGQLFQCPDCPGFHYRYHSCRVKGFASRGFSSEWMLLKVMFQLVFQEPSSTTAL